MTAENNQERTLIRVFAGAARSTGKCPAKTAAKSRISGAHPFPKVELVSTFSLDPMMRALNLIERGQHRDIDQAIERVCSETGRRRVHPGVRRWTEHAVRSYLRATANSSAVPFHHVWVCQWRGTAPGSEEAVCYEVRAWGRFYQSADGRVRELRLPVTQLRTEARDPGEVAVMAWVLATGVPAKHVWNRPSTVLPHVQVTPERVRIVEVDCLHGVMGDPVEFTPAEAEAAYREHGQRALRAAVDGTDRVPGFECKDCALVSDCAAVPKAAGLLGVKSDGGPRRHLSASEARRHHTCASQYLLRLFNLPRDRAIEYDEAATRGQLVHDLLQTRHEQDPTTPCAPGDHPDEATPLTAGRWQVQGRQAALARKMIDAHASLCPARPDHDATTFRPEAAIICYDTDADVVINARPDLLYLDADGWVWRETKTDGSPGWWPQPDPLVRWPQLAFAVLLISHGVLGSPSEVARIEVEILHPTGPELRTIDPWAAEHQATARQVVTDLVLPWHSDTEFAPNAMADCTRCEVARWCPSARVPEAVQ